LGRWVCGPHFALVFTFNGFRASSRLSEVGPKRACGKLREDGRLLGKWESRQQSSRSALGAETCQRQVSRLRRCGSFHNERRPAVSGGSSHTARLMDEGPDDPRWVAGVGPNLSSSRTLFARRGRVQRLAGGDHSTTGELIPPLANSPGGCHEIRRARSRGRLAVCRVDAALCAGCRRTQSAQPTGIALGAREPLIR